MNFNKPFLIALLFCLFTKIAIAKNYYFSTKFGNDSYNSIQAQNPSTPWKTLIKLNSFFFDINPGDSILFKRGEVFDGSIKISKSGTSMLPIVLGAYGKGAKPVINGLTTLTVWTKIDKGIYQSRCPFCKVNDNMVLINGTPRAIGRWPNSDSPNKGYLTIESHEGKISITGNGLTGTHDWIGAELVLRKNHYIIDRRTIASQSGNSLTFSSGSNYAIQNGFGFFIQNDPRTLDQLGEWYFDPTQKNMEIYFGSKDPSLYLIRTSIVDTLVYIDRNNYITIDDISFEGANMKSFCILSSSHITIQNCRFDFSGADAIFGAKSSYIYLKSNTINHSNNNAILIGDYAKTDKSNNIYVGNNTIKNTATLAGMGLKVDEQNDQNAIFIIGANCIVENNVIDSTGYIPIWHLGKNFLVQRNFITNFCFVKDDGGGTYSNNYGDDHIEHSNQRILFNIILNGIGASAGAPKNAGTGVGASGIYLDVNSSFDSVIGNTIGNCMLFGLLISDDFNVTVRNNTIYNCHSQMIIFSDAYPNASHTNNLEIKNNIFVAKTLDQLLVNYNSMFNDIDSFGIIDSNYYVRPLRKNKYVFYKVVDGISNNRAYTLKSWQNRYGYDIHSKESPIVVNPYTYITIGTNKFSNGTFNNNINGISYFDGGGGAGNMAVGWDSNNKLLPGSLKVAYSKPSFSNTSPHISIPVGEISSSKYYILKFSTLGTVANKTLFAYLKNKNSDVTPRIPAAVTNSRTENEILFSLPKTSTTSTTLIFTWDDSELGSTFYLDNVELYEAKVTYTNPDNYIRFEYNATNSAKTISLDKRYIDVLNNQYQNKISLNPFSSVILFTTDSQVP